MFHLGIGRSQIEWKLKAKTQISVFPGAKIGQNDHSNPYIESTTVLSDKDSRKIIITLEVEWADIKLTGTIDKTHHGINRDKVQEDVSIGDL